MGHNEQVGWVRQLQRGVDVTRVGRVARGTEKRHLPRIAVRWNEQLAVDRRGAKAREEPRGGIVLLRDPLAAVTDVAPRRCRIFVRGLAWLPNDHRQVVPTRWYVWDGALERDGVAPLFDLDPVLGGLGLVVRTLIDRQTELAVDENVVLAGPMPQQRPGHGQHATAAHGARKVGDAGGVPRLGEREATRKDVCLGPRNAVVDRVCLVIAATWNNGVGVRCRPLEAHEVARAVAVGGAAALASTQAIIARRRGRCNRQ